MTKEEKILFLHNSVTILHLIILNFLSFAFFTALFTFSYFSQDLITKDRIMQHNNSGFILYDVRGKPFFAFGQTKVISYIPSDRIPKNLQAAVIAVEDKDFYHHPGLSWKAIVRSLISNIKAKGPIYGASTLTQQLAKNDLLKPRKKFFRKYQEIILALLIEAKYTKSEILEMYLNTIYFGAGAYGVEEASQTYFGKPVQDISLEEAALLAGVLPAPSVYNPLFGDKEKAKNRQRIVLNRMYEEGYINNSQKEDALKANLKLNYKSGINFLAPHYALIVRDQLIKMYGDDIFRSGYKVYTGLDLDFQKEAEKTVRKHVEKLKFNDVTNGAVIMIDPKNGEVRAMVGSVDWYDNKFGKVNMTISPRQPGSSFKPIVYSAAFEKRFLTPASILKDQPVTYKTPGGLYSPLNYDRKFRGNVTVRRALSNSLNIPSVQVMSMLGVDRVLEMVNRLGITTLKDTNDYGLALVLGAGEVSLLELTNVYATFADNGMKKDPVFITKILDKRNQLIFQNKNTFKQVLSPEVAFLISSILSDAKTRFEEFGSALDNETGAAVKTGTTDDFRDSWTLGYTPDLAIGVWVGNSDNSSMDNIAGSLGAAPIWRELMDKFSNVRDYEFMPPSNIVQSKTCFHTAKKNSQQVTNEYFLKGTQPVKSCI